MNKHAERFKQLRKNQRISANQLAQKTGVSVATITRFEKEETDIRLKTVSKLMGALGLNLADLDHTSKATPLKVWQNTPHFRRTDKTFLFHHEQGVMADKAVWIGAEIYVIDSHSQPKVGDLILWLEDRQAQLVHAETEHLDSAYGLVLQSFPYPEA
jgi:transcriptional regulator with XRE-family HTH domain